MPSLVRGIPRNALLSVGVVAVSLIVLYPRVTEAEEVADEDRYGEYQDDGERFGDIVVKGELVAANGAPGGWSLVRTAENESDQPAEAEIEERILQSDTMVASRVGGESVAVLTRHQKIKLGPHERKVVGTTFGKALGESMTANAKIAQGTAYAYAHMGENGMPSLRPYKEYRVEYLRELRAGQTAAKPAMRGVDFPLRAVPPSQVALREDDLF